MRKGFETEIMSLKCELGEYATMQYKGETIQTIDSDKEEKIVINQPEVQPEENENHLKKPAPKKKMNKMAT